jgi:exosortase
MSSATETTPATATAAAAPTTTRPAALAAAVAVVAAALAWAYWTDLADLVRIWTEDPNYSHGFLVVPIAAFMFWRLWPRGAEAAPRPSAWGWAALAALAGLRFLLYERGEFWLERATLILSAAALVLAYGGWPLLRRTWPAVAFLCFMLTVPVALNAKVSLPLQRMASWGSCSLLRLLGLWVMDEGNVIVVGDDQLEVAAACNGLAMLMSLAATIAAATILIPMPAWKRVVLILSVVPVALACNILRIAATAWCYHLTESEAVRHQFHDWAGLAMMPLALAAVALELWWMSWLVTEEEVTVAGPLIGVRPLHS